MAPRRAGQRSTSDFLAAVDAEAPEAVVTMTNAGSNATITVMKVAIITITTGAMINAITIALMLLTMWKVPVTETKDLDEVASATMPKILRDRET